MKPDLYNKKIRPVVQNPRLWQNKTTFQIPQDACKYTKQYFCELSWDSDILARCLKTDKFSVSVPKGVYYIDKLNAEIFGSRYSKQTEDYSTMGKWHGADSHRVGTQKNQKAWGHNDPKGEHKSRNKARKNYNKILK